MPISCPGGQVYIIRAGDTLYLIARRYGTTVNAIMAANPGLNPYNLQIGQEICIPVTPPVTCPNGITYTIRAGDTLYALAQRYNTTVNAIIAANPGIDPNNLQVGRIICIPQAPAPPPPPPPVRPDFVSLNPTDNTPDAVGIALVLSSALGVMVTNVPRPEELPDGEVYKLWVKRPTAADYAVTTMEEVAPGFWVGWLAPGFSVPGSDVLVTAEPAANTTAPTGLGVVSGRV